MFCCVRISSSKSDGCLECVCARACVCVCVFSFSFASFLTHLPHVSLMSRTIRLAGYSGRLENLQSPHCVTVPNLGLGVTLLPPEGVTFLLVFPGWRRPWPVSPTTGPTGGAGWLSGLAPITLAAGGEVSEKARLLPGSERLCWQHSGAQMTQKCPGSNRRAT